MSRQIHFEEYVELITGQLTTALRAFEQLGNLIRAGQVILPSPVGEEGTAGNNHKELHNNEQEPEQTDVTAEVPVVKTTSPKTLNVLEGSSADVITEALGRLNNALAVRTDVAPSPRQWVYDQPEVPLAIDTEEFDTPPLPNGGVVPVEIDPLEQFNEVEKTVIKAFMEKGMELNDVLKAIDSIKTGEVQTELRANQARQKAAETLIDTKPYLQFFIGVEGLMKRFVHSNLVPTGRGELSVGQGGCTLPYYDANLNRAKLEALKKFGEGFYRNPTNEEDWSLLIQLDDVTIVFPSINLFDNPLPYIVDKTGPMADVKQVISVLPFPLLKALYEEVEARLKALNGI